MPRRVTTLGFGLLLILGLLVHPIQGTAQSRFTGLADTTVTSAATLVRAANASRTALICTNTSATVAVRVGGSAVTATAGVQLRAATSLTISGPYAVYMISEGANVTVACSEELQ